jgi:cell division septum initiation protein DivIVA
MPDHVEEDARAGPEESRALETHADIGDKVNAIIKAAEAAAEEIAQTARREADEVLHQAEQQAAARIEELTREAVGSRAEADQYARDMREAADSYGTQHRRSAEEEARRLLADSEERAKVLLETAQLKAEQIDRDVGERHETLRREARMLEARRQRVLESLRDLAAQLQDALVEPTENERQDQALMDALNVERRR